jgi:hypothetical protein
MSNWVAACANPNDSILAALASYSRLFAGHQRRQLRRRAGGPPHVVDSGSHAECWRDAISIADFGI